MLPIPPIKGTRKQPLTYIPSQKLTYLEDQLVYNHGDRTSPKDRVMGPLPNEERDVIFFLHLSCSVRLRQRCNHLVDLSGGAKEDLVFHGEDVWTVLTWDPGDYLRGNPKVNSPLIRPYFLGGVALGGYP